MKNKLLFAGVIGAMVSASGAAHAAEKVLATEPFVRSAITHAKGYADSAVSAAMDSLADVAFSGSYNDLIDAPNMTNYVTTGDMGSALAGKQNVLPTPTGNNGKVLGVVDGAGTLGWVVQSAADVSGKAELQSGDTLNNVAVMDGAGQYVDSGVAIGDLATQTWVGARGFQTASDVTTAISGKANTSDLGSAAFADTTDFVDVSAIANMEVTTNKLRSVSGGGAGITAGATDTQYASGKAVYDALSGKENAIVGGADEGKVLMGTAAGWQWIATSPDVFVE